MTNSRINTIYITIFLILLSLPLLLLIVRVKVEDESTNEKINLKFKNNFPLKKDYFKIYSFIKNDVFNSQPCIDKVIKLENGWYFLGDSYSDNLSESKGFLKFTDEELAIIEKNLNLRNDWCKKNGIKYYFSIAPNKESIYGNLLPFGNYSLNKKMSQVDSICKKNGIMSMDLGSKFPKNSSIPLYYKTDTHWNDYGAYYGYKEIIDNINKTNNFYIKPIPLSTFNMPTAFRDYIGDLKSMIGETKGENSISLEYKNTESLAQLEKQKIKQPDIILVSPEEFEIRYTSTINNDIKILVLRDSFGGALLKFVKESFNESVFIFDRRFDTEIISNEKPTIIVEEIVERNVDLFLEDNFISP